MATLKITIIFLVVFTSKLTLATPITNGTSQVDQVSKSVETTSVGSSGEDTTELPNFDPTSKDTSTFSCRGKATGFYADVKLNCRVYHFCTQLDGVAGTNYNRMSYICLEGSIFDQNDLNCVREVDVKTPCNKAEEAYDTSNKQFDQKEESQPSYSDSLAATIMMNPIGRFIAGR